MASNSSLHTDVVNKHLRLSCMTTEICFLMLFLPCKAFSIWGTQTCILVKLQLLAHSLD